SDGFSRGCAAAGACAGHGGRDRRRADLTGVGMILLQVSLTVLAKVTHGRSEIGGRADLPERYGRYRWLFLDGLRPARGGATTLPAPSLTTQQAHLLLGAPPREEQA